MEMEEVQKITVIKPVATRPSCFAYKPFAELLSGAMNGPSNRGCSRTPAIRPKTIRLKSAGIHNSIGKAEPMGISVSSSGVNILKIDDIPTIIYKPTAKLPPATTVPHNFNMKSCAHNQQKEAGDESKRVKSYEHSRMTSSSQNNVEEDERSLLHQSSSADYLSNDGYNWRKYGQKQVKGSEYPRSYYKCTHPKCPVKKKVERLLVDDEIAEIVYNGEHIHPKPCLPSPRYNSLRDGVQPHSNDSVLWSEQITPLQNEDKLSSKFSSRTPPPLFGAFSTLGKSCGPSGRCGEGSQGLLEAVGDDDDDPKGKRRKSRREAKDGGILMQAGIGNMTDSEATGDGYRWRKYGQKVVKGNTYPRSYYRCTNPKCSVRKYVERATDDPKSFITTYEGKHNHDAPTRRNPKP
ncbi:unnamed protein product [Cuscuta campestris]|uniref:WRKY domain-containing protein n=1 Tax=Cuscuta campestris TaxID=132261 RepID=A0A484N151_9ASTE|nr:unnamed protein product [Cuscuta campestris]